MHSAEISANESAASLAEWQPEPQATGPAVFYGLGEQGTIVAHGSYCGNLISCTRLWSSRLDAK